MSDLVAWLTKILDAREWWANSPTAPSNYDIASEKRHALADIAAKRAIIDEYVARDKDADLMLGPDCLRQREWSGLRLAVQIIATEYAERPGYQDDWRPLSMRTHP